MATTKTMCRIVGRLTTLTPDDANRMRNFRRWCYDNKPASAFYFEHFQELSERMDADGVVWAEFVGFERAVLTLLRAGSNEAAYQLYRDTIIELIKQHWPDCDLPEWHKAYRDYQVPTA